MRLVRRVYTFRYLFRFFCRGQFWVEIWPGYPRVIRSMKIRGSVVSLSCIFPHPPENIEE